MPLSKAERLEEFRRRLLNAPPGSSQANARDLLNRTLNAVEDEHSGVTYDPALPRDDGRMYPPQDDSIRKTSIPGAMRLRSTGHNIFLGANGAITIRYAENGVKPEEGTIFLRKPGHDGKEI